MNELLSFIKIMCIIQVLLITSIVLSIFLYRNYLNYFKKQKHHCMVRANAIFTRSLDNLSEITDTDLKLFQRNLVYLLPIIKHFDAAHQDNLHWQKTKDAILRKILLPKARQYRAKRSWFKRFFTTQVFQQIYEEQDIDTIKQLIADPIPLIALNAAQIAISSAEEQLIKQLIKSFAVNRHLQNAVFIQAIESNPAALSIIAKHLKSEKDIYARLFCYQLLSSHADIHPDLEQIQNDMNSENMDLQIAALTCYATTHPPNLQVIFAEKIQDNRWEIRATIAKLIGRTGDSAMCSMLEKALKDPNWWVRINATESLSQLGAEGLQILQRQRPEDDRFAYDAARRVLAVIQMTDK